MPRLSLRIKLLASFILILLPVLGLLIYGYNQAHERRLDTLLDTQMQTAEAVASVVDASFDEAFALAWALTNDPVVHTLDPSQIDHHLQRLAPQFPQFEAFGVTNASGDVVGISIPIPPGAPRPGSAVDRPAFKQVMATGQPVVSDLIISRATLRPSTSLYVPLRDEEGKLIGAVGVAPYLDAFSKRIESVALGPEQAVLLIDRTGTVALHTALPEISSQQRNIGDFEPVKAALDGRPTKVRQFISPLQGDVRLGAFVPTPKYGWVVEVSEREDLAVAPVRAALRDQLLGFGAVAILSVGLILFLSERLLRPIRRLASHALALGRGDLEQQVQIETGDEIEDLGRTFNQMADRIRARTAQLQGVINNMVDWVFVSNAQKCITLANGAGLRLLGLTSQPKDELCNLAEFAGHLRIRHPDGKPFTSEELPLVRALNDEITVQKEEIIFNLESGQEVYVRTSAAPIKDDRGRIIGAVEVMRDVTESIRLDEMKDQFITVAAHELKTPVTIMKGYAQILERSIAVPAEQQKILNAIDRGADRINRIVKDLLDISQLHVGEIGMTYEKVDVQRLVKEVVDRIAGTTTKHRMRIVKSEPAVVHGSPDRLEQVLINLIDNAIKYSPKGGDIDVGVEARDHDAVVWVRDCGIGIPKDKQQHIFERFFSAHTGTPHDYGGMGVGLYISDEIIKRHGGRMWFDSAEGNGSTFYFSLPLSGTNGARSDTATS